MRYLLKIQYDGSKFYGFQRLNNLPTVQREIEKSLSNIFQQDIKIKGAGRTDRNVHAYSQMAHFDSDKEMEIFHLRYCLNKIINRYIYIADIKKVDDNFHARFSVLTKTYLYKIYQGDYDPLKTDYYWYLNKEMSLKLMNECASLFIGVHDFENFVSGKKDNYMSHIYDVNIALDNNEIIITFTAKSFYKYMVRAMVGAIVDVGVQKRTIKEVKDALDKKTNQRFSIAPGNGLYLMDIKY